MKRFLSLLALLLAGSTAAQQFPTASPTTTPTLVIWVPDDLAMPNSEALTLFQEHTDAFSASRDVSVEIRVKKSSDVGGILSTLRSASTVAPGALPALTILRRSDLLISAQEDLIQPVDTLLAPGLLEAASGVLSLCRVNNALYGVPYLLEVLHTAWRHQPSRTVTNWDFASVLERRQTFIFPGGASVGLNNTLLTQVIAADGLTETGALALNVATLQDILGFYEAAAASDMISPEVLGYFSSRDYLSRIQSGDEITAVLTSTQYLRLRDTPEGADLRPGFVPTRDGRPATLLDGWCWVVVTPDEARQQLAASYIAALSGASSVRETANALNILPARPDLLRDVVGTRDEAFYSSLLQNVWVSPQNNTSLALERAIQDALQGIINNQIGAVDATEAIAAQFGS
jgi:ABC-type glycerol-3-phosphate transport system substrate-binding protein